MTAPATAAPQRGGQAAPVARPYPFPVGVYETTVQDYDQTLALGATIAAWASGLQMPNFNVSPTGWLRTLWFDFTVTIAGNAATPVLAPDSPWNLVQRVTLYDLGGEIVMQLNGYEWMVINKFGGYYEIGDPRADITYTVTTGSGASAGSFHFIVALPFEAVARDALGTAQNEAKPGYRVEIYLGGPTDVYSTQPTSTGTASLRLRAYPESYTEPSSSAPGGRPFAPTPPLPGTFQYWRSENGPWNAGAGRYDLSNGVGFPIRNVIYYARAVSDTTRATADGNWPDPSTFLMGNVNIFTRSRQLWLSRLGKDFGLTSNVADSAMGRENGVYPIYFTRDFGLRAGAEVRFKYLDTQVNSLLRFSGTMGVSVNLFALVNWLAIPSRNRYSLIAGGN